MVTLEDNPGNMFGKIMSWPDTLISLAFEICTCAPIPEMEEINQNPRNLKMRLAYEIAKIYHGGEKAKKAEENFINTFQKKEIPGKIEEITEFGNLGTILVSKKILSSRSEWRRLVDEGAIKKLGDKGEEKIADFKIIAAPGVYKIGKYRFIKIK